MPGFASIDSPNSVLAALGGGGGGPGSSGSRSGTQVIPGMMDVYNQTLGLNQSNYSNVLGSYAGGQATLAAGLPDIYKGYGDALGNITKTLGQGGDWGVATPAAQAISEAFAKTQGQTQQDMINRGLGNTTALASFRNQNTLQAGRAYASLGAQLAQTYAGYQAQFGLAEQAAKMQGLGMQSNLAAQQGSTLGGYRFGNTAGNLTGGYSESSSHGGTPSYNYGASAGRGGGGGFGGGGGQGSLKRGADFSVYGGDNGTYSTFTPGSGAGPAGPETQVPVPGGGPPPGYGGNPFKPDGEGFDFYDAYGQGYNQSDLADPRSTIPSGLDYPVINQLSPGGMEYDPENY